MKVQVGGIYYCKEVRGDESSDHYWLVLHADKEKILYLTFTSQIEKFVFVKSIMGGITGPDSEHHPKGVVFLDIDEVRDNFGSRIFDKDTVLNCFYIPKEIPRAEFDVRIRRKTLKYRNAHLPDPYLMQIILCAKVSKWSRRMFRELLDNQCGIGCYIDRFFDRIGK